MGISLQKTVYWQHVKRKNGTCITKMLCVVVSLYYFSWDQKWELESLSTGNIGWGIKAWSSTELGFALLQRFAIISTAWLGCTRLTFSSEWFFATTWLLSIVGSSIQETIDRKIFSLILCDIAASMSLGNPRSAQVVLANASGLIPVIRRHVYNKNTAIFKFEQKSVEHDHFCHGVLYINSPHSEVTSHWNLSE